MKNTIRTLLLGWDRLGKVEQLTCNTRSKESIQKGKALVSVIKQGNNVLIFQEKGSWSGIQEMHFTNTLRWTLDRNVGVISLEHLRYGSNSPVFLVNLTPTTNYFLTSLHSHVCKKDTYTAKMYLHHHLIHLHWQILGPKKNTDMHSYYF